MRALDVSNFSGIFTKEQGDFMRDEARLLVVNVHDETIALAQIGATQCMEHALYAQFYSSVAIDRELNKASSISQHLNWPFLWLAMEDLIPNGVHPDMVVAWIKAIELRAYQFGFPVGGVGLYTRREWWEKYTGNSDAFKHLPLWDANYDNIPDLAVFAPYGGWTAAAMKQYAANVSVAGVTVDRNVY